MRLGITFITLTTHSAHSALGSVNLATGVNIFLTKWRPKIDFTFHDFKKKESLDRRAAVYWKTKSISTLAPPQGYNTYSRNKTYYYHYYIPAIKTVQ